MQTCIINECENSTRKSDPHKGSDVVRNNILQTNNGRRGPAIYRLINSVDKTADELGITRPFIGKRLKYKPPLTPGLGTTRMTRVGQNKPVIFTIEPRMEDEFFGEWLEAMRRMVRLGNGLPSFVRRRVWSNLADRQFLKHHLDWPHVLRTSFQVAQSHSEDEICDSQIKKDLHRTGCDQFDSEDHRVALKRVLLAYARWNKRVGYCQGFNVIVATILDVMDGNEEDAFKVMVYLIDYVLPESYFTESLQALSVDIAVFRQLLESRLPRLIAHLNRLQSDTDAEINASCNTTSQTPMGSPRTSHCEPPLLNVFIIQWFLTLFSTCLPRDTLLRVWDSILLEGSEVILRTAVVIIEFLASRLTQVKSSEEFYTRMNQLMRDFAESRIVTTQEFIFEIYRLAPFPYPDLQELRDKVTYNIAPLVRSDLLNLRTTDRKMRKDRVLSYSVFGTSGLFSRWRTRVKQTGCLAVNTTPSVCKKEHPDTHDSAGRISDKPVCESLYSKTFPSLLRTVSKPVQSNAQKNSGSSMNKQDSSPSPDDSIHVVDGNLNDTHTSSERIMNATIQARQNSVSYRMVEDVGPGAVAVSSVMSTHSNPPAALQARMGTNLSQLRSLYVRQLEQLRNTTITIPHCSSLEIPDGDEPHDGWPVQHLRATMPQECWSVDLSQRNSIDNSVFISNSDGQQEKITDDVVLVSCVKQVSVNLSTITEPIDSVFGAVKSWQSKAIWSSRPSIDEHPSSIGNSIETVCLSPAGKANTCHAEQDSKSKLWRMAEKSKRRSISNVDPVSCENSTVLAMVSEKSHSTPVSPLSKIQANMFLPQNSVGRYVVDYNQSGEALENSLVVSLDSVPWKDAQLNLITNFKKSLHKQNQTKEHFLSHPFTITPSRRHFAARFGMYKNTQNLPKNFPTSFTERVQNLVLQGRFCEPQITS